MNSWYRSPQPRDADETEAGLKLEDARLDSLFLAYHAACEPGEVSANFMPELWQKIEHVQNTTFSFRRIARGFLTAAAAMSLVLATLVVAPAPKTSAVYNATYVETLAAHDAETADQARPDVGLEEVVEDL